MGTVVYHAGIVLVLWWVVGVACLGLWLAVEGLQDKHKDNRSDVDVADLVAWACFAWIGPFILLLFFTDLWAWVGKKVIPWWERVKDKPVWRRKGPRS